MAASSDSTAAPPAARLFAPFVAREQVAAFLGTKPEGIEAHLVARFGSVEGGIVYLRREAAQSRRLDAWMIQQAIAGADVGVTATNFTSLADWIETHLELAVLADPTLGALLRAAHRQLTAASSGISHLSLNAMAVLLIDFALELHRPQRISDADIRLAVAALFDRPPAGLRIGPAPSSLV